MAGWITRLYHHRIISRFMHTPAYLIARHLKDCYSVLDLGCGPDSLIQFGKAGYSVGVDIFAPFIQESKKKNIHNRYILADISSIDFKPKSFDAVLLIEALEHLNKNQGEALLEKIESWAIKKVIISCPNGFLPQDALSGNPFQVHRSGWGVAEMTCRGYKAYGLSGWKFLRKDNTSEGYGSSGEAIFSTIRFRPGLFWVLFSGLTQLAAFYLPKAAYEVFYVKEL